MLWWWQGWYSWAIESLADAIYIFGFIFMTPQLFINYKLKSVAHMPWKVMIYKFFNTFIDDVFAFLVTMPTAHRIACFRDDLVFFIFLYQRYLYRVDKKRANEYGYAYDDGDDGGGGSGRAVLTLDEGAGAGAEEVVIDTVAMAAATTTAAIAPASKVKAE